MDDPVAGKYYALFGTEWTTENLQQLVDTVTGGLDFIVTGSLRQTAGDFRTGGWCASSRSKISRAQRYSPCVGRRRRQTPSSVSYMSKKVRQYMEWAPEKNGLFTYTLVRRAALLGHDALGVSPRWSPLAVPRGQAVAASHAAASAGPGLRRRRATGVHVGVGVALVSDPRGPRRAPRRSAADGQCFAVGESIGDPGTAGLGPGSATRICREISGLPRR